jgi:cysteine desulfurase
VLRLTPMERPGIYFDHNATTPLSANVKSRVPDLMETYGNPSSIHFAGRPAKLILRESRRSLAKLLQCDPLELIFTSGGSESNNTAIKGIFEAMETGWTWSGPRSSSANSERNELIISAVEHPSVMNSAEFIARKGYKVHIIPVDAENGLRMDLFEAALSEKTALVSMMFANNETGYLFPTEEICRRTHEAGALFHMDAVQGLGKAEMKLRDWNVDLASFSAHKFYAFKGTGILFAKKGVMIEALLQGGAQERHRRAGTENIIGIGALGEMAKCEAQIAEKINAVKVLRDRLEDLILGQIPDVKIVGGPLPRLGNTSSLVIDGVDGETLLINLDVQGFAVSTGAACSSGNPEPSPVLLAMGLTRKQAQSSLRLSLGWENTEAEVNEFLEVLRRTVERLRSFKQESGRENVGQASNQRGVVNV